MSKIKWEVGDIFRNGKLSSLGTTIDCAIIATGESYYSFLNYSTGHISNPNIPVLGLESQYTTNLTKENIDNLLIKYQCFKVGKLEFNIEEKFKDKIS